jgi:son of sevenless-like protein
MTAEALFNTLMDYYNRPQPEDLNVSELEDWIERGQLRTQRRVLELFGEWLQSHQLVRYEPHIAEKLDHFLQSITSSSNVKVAKMIRIRIQDLVRISSDS